MPLLCRHESSFRQDLQTSRRMQRQHTTSPMMIVPHCSSSLEVTTTSFRRLCSERTSKRMPSILRRSLPTSCSRDGATILAESPVGERSQILQSIGPKLQLLASSTELHEERCVIHATSPIATVRQLNEPQAFRSRRAVTYIHPRSFYGACFPAI